MSSRIQKQVLAEYVRMIFSALASDPRMKRSNVVYSTSDPNCLTMNWSGSVSEFYRMFGDATDNVWSSTQLRPDVKMSVSGGDDEIYACMQFSL